MFCSVMGINLVSYYSEKLEAFTPSIKNQYNVVSLRNFPEIWICKVLVFEFFLSEAPAKSIFQMTLRYSGTVKSGCWLAKYNGVNHMVSENSCFYAGFTWNKLYLEIILSLAVLFTVLNVHFILND